MPVKKQVKIPAKAEVPVAPVAAPIIQAPVTLESIVLDTEEKQRYMQVINAYRKQNPKKFVAKEKEFIKKLLVM